MTPEHQRIDRWLWFARIVKTRSRAAFLVNEGHVRVNRIKVRKPSHPVRPGDVMTLIVAGRLKVIEIRHLASRRGPAPEAWSLYRNLAPPASPQGAPR